MKREHYKSLRTISHKEPLGPGGHRFGRAAGAQGHGVPAGTGVARFH
jgi:hypothetical protein